MSSVRRRPSPRQPRTSRLVLREPGRYFFREVTLHPQDRVLLAEPLQLFAFVLGQVLVRDPAGVSSFLHPLAQRHLVDADTPRHFDDGSARIEDEANGLILVFLGEVSACRHAFPSAGTQRQSTTGDRKSVV